MVILPVITGYLIGSILPAYFLAKWLKGIDIRQVGTRHAGTTNVKRNVGLGPAIVTAAYDTTKGLLSMAIASNIFHTSKLVVYLSGVAAIFGHVFPFYLKFRGGRGVATTTGILIFMLGKIFLSVLKFDTILSDLLFMTFLTLSIYITTKDENFLAVTILPVLCALLIIRVPLSLDLAFILFLILYAFFVSSMNMKKMRIFKEKDANIITWRILIRPAAISFPILHLFISRASLTLLIGISWGIAFLMDFVRLFWARANEFLMKRLKKFRIYKAKEEKRFSSITTFLMGVFLSYLLFEESIFVACLGFLIFGDMMAKIIGINYGRKHIVRSEQVKTLEGTAGFFAAALTISYFLWITNILPIHTGLVGAAIATLVEFLPIPVDDNVSVPILSGSVMMLMSNF